MKEISFLESCILNKNNCLIYGEEGIGKTYLLKSLSGCYIEFPTPKNIIREIIKFYGIELTEKAKYATISELFKVIESLLPNTILLIDNFEARKDLVNFLRIIDEKGGTLIIASEKRKSFEFIDEYLEIKRPGKKEVEEICKSEMLFFDKLKGKLCYNISKGNPGKLKRIIRKWNFAVENLELNYLDKKETIEFFRNIKPKIPKRVNILPVKYLFILGFGALIFRYYFWDKGDFRSGYLVASAGYLLLITWRLAK